MSAEQTLTAAADIIEQHGLYRDELWPGASNGAAYRPGAPCCPIGAIAAVLGDGTPQIRVAFPHPATWLLRQRIAARRGYMGIVRWVAVDRAPVAEVLDVMRGNDA